MPVMTPTAIGYGAGDTNPAGWPNALRVFLARPSARGTRERDTVLQVETNLDDVNPQTYEYVMEQLFSRGALDVTLAPVIMKRGRPGIVLTCLAASLVSGRPRLRCVIAGDGPERPDLERLVGERALGNNVTFAGMIPRREVLALMLRTKVLLHPSRYEGFGYVFAEALACGAEVVSFRVGCAREHPGWHIAAGETASA